MSLFSSKKSDTSPSVSIHSSGIVAMFTFC